MAGLLSGLRGYRQVDRRCWAGRSHRFQAIVVLSIVCGAFSFLLPKVPRGAPKKEAQES